MKTAIAQPLDPAKPPVPRRPSFLARPFWRDYVLAYVGIGTGLMLGDCALPTRGSDGAVLLTLAAVVGGAGAIVLCCAVGHSIWSTVRRPGDAG